jgi:hypothetical protein
LDPEGFDLGYWPSGFSISESADLLLVGWNYHLDLVSLKRFKCAARTPVATRKYSNTYSFVRSGIIGRRLFSMQENLCTGISTTAAA